MKNQNNTFKTWFGKLMSKPITVSALSSVLAVFGGLFVGLMVMLVVNPANALGGFGTILLGGFNDGMTSIGNTFYFGVPIILTGLSVAFAFRTGLFNIGATGQLTIAAFVAVYIGVKWTFLGPTQWIVALLFAMLAGAVWGAIPGILKAYRNVHEVVSSIMLNYVAMYLKVMLIYQLIYNPTHARAQTPSSNALIPNLGLDRLFPGSNVNIGIFIAILLVIITHIILNKTTFGYELKCVGFNRDASKYAGINEKRNIVLSMTISGAIAGAAGAVMFLVPGKHLEAHEVMMMEGFTGIAISLLGLNAPIGVFIAGIFYGSLELGGYYLQLYDFMPEIIDIIIAVIIYFSALSLFLHKFVGKFLRKRFGKDVPLTDGIALPIEGGADE